MAWWFARSRPQDLRAPLLRVARLEAAQHPAERFAQRSPFSEERLRLGSLFAQDQGMGPRELARRPPTLGLDLARHPGDFVMELVEAQAVWIVAHERPVQVDQELPEVQQRDLGLAAVRPRDQDGLLARHHELRAGRCAKAPAIPPGIHIRTYLLEADKDGQ